MAGTDLERIGNHAGTLPFTDLFPRTMLVTSNDGAGSDETFTVHVAREHHTRSLIRGAIARYGGPGTIRVRTHRANRLNRPKSLERLLAHFGHGRVVADPTGAFTRSRSLLTFAKDVRALLPGKVARVLFSSEWRTVYVVLAPSAYVRNEKVKTVDLAAAERQVAMAFNQVWSGDQTFQPALRIGFEPPMVPVVAIDDASRTGKITGAAMRGGAAAVGAALGFGVATAFAADLGPVISSAQTEPAVSAPNGKLAVSGGYVDEDNFKGDGALKVAGSYSIPLGFQYGAQFDGVFNLRGEDLLFGVGGQVFWRDPSQGLVGLTATFVTADRGNGRPNQNLSQIGAYGEWYLDQLTIAAAVGAEFGKRIDDGPYANLDLKWYFTENLAFNVGGAISDQNNGLFKFGAEFQPGYASLRGLTYFADGTVGGNDTFRIMAGVRFYFGDDKSLIDRHRKDDPDNAADRAADNLAGTAASREDSSNSSSASSSS